MLLASTAVIYPPQLTSDTKPACCFKVTITVPGFVKDGQEEVLVNFQITGDVDSCDDRYLVSL